MSGVANLDDLLAPAKQDTSGVANLDDLFGKQPTQDISLNGPVGSSASEILAEDESNRQQNIAKLTQIKQMPNATPAQVKRLDMLIKIMSNHTLYRRITEDRAVGSNLVRGLLRGAADSFHGAADLLPAAISLIPGLKEFMKPVRRMVAEGRAQDELVYDPEGGLGAFGRVAGEAAPLLLGNMNPYSVAADATLGVAKALPIGATMRTAIEAGQKGTLLQKVGTSLLGGLPLDAIQAASIPDATNKQKLEAFAMNLGISAGVPLAHAGYERIRGAKPATAPTPATKPDTELAADKAARVAQVAAMESKITEVDAFKKLRAKAIKAWSNSTVEMRKALAPNVDPATHGKSWKDLGPEEKAAVIDAFKAQQPAEPAPPSAAGETPPPTNTNVDQGQTPPAVTPPTHEQVSAKVSKALDLLSAQKAALESGNMEEMKRLNDELKALTTTGPAPSGEAGRLNEVDKLTAEQLAAKRGETISQTGPNQFEVGGTRETPPVPAGAAAFDQARGISTPTAAPTPQPKATPNLIFHKIREAGSKIRSVLSEYKMVGRNASEAVDGAPWRVTTFGGFNMRPAGHDLFRTYEEAVASINLKDYEQVTRETKRPLPSQRSVDNQRKAAIDELEEFKKKYKLREIDLVPEATVRRILKMSKRSDLFRGATPVGLVRNVIMREGIAGDEFAKLHAEAGPKAETLPTGTEPQPSSAPETQPPASGASPSSMSVPYTRNEGSTVGVREGFKVRKDEKISTTGTGAAVKVGDKIFRGHNHPDAKDAAARAGVGNASAIDGFWAQTPNGRGRFVTRAEGELIVRKNQPEVAKSLDSARKLDEKTELDSLDLKSEGVAKVGEGPLRTVDLDKPLEQHTIDELDNLIDKVDDSKGSEIDTAHDLITIGKAKDVLREKKIIPVGAPPTETPSFSNPAMTKGAARKSYDLRLDPVKARAMMKAPVSGMTIEDLQLHKNDLVSRISGMDTSSAEPYVKRMDEVMAEIANRGRKAPGPGPESGFTVGEIPTVVTSSFVGFMVGSTQGDTPEERIENGLLAAAGFGLGSAYLLRRVRANSPANKSVPAYQQKIREKVISLEADPGQATKGFWPRVQEFYTQLSRRSLPATLAAKSLGVDRLSFAKNFAKQAELFGLYRNRTEAWWFIKPQRIDLQGNLIDTDALAAQRIADMVGGDTSTLGDLMASAHALEQAALPTGKSTGIDLIAAKQMFLNTPKKYHDAMAEARKYALALAQVAVDGEVLNQDAIAKFAAQLFYAPMDRIFKGQTGKQSQSMSTVGAGKTGVSTGQPVKAAKGSQLAIRNPFESLISNTGRFWKAYEKNRMGLAMIDAVQNAKNSGQPGLAEVADRIAVAIPTAKTTPTVAEIARVQDLKQEISNLGGNISDREALDHVRLLSNESLDLTDNVLWLRRNGKVEGWRLNDQLVQMFKSFNPQEMDMMWKIAGAPAQIARIGITASPRFVLWQAFRDNWQFFMNSKFGHSIPFFDQMKGWYANVSNSKEYQNFVSAGGSGDSIADQGLKLVRGKSDVLEEIRRPPTTTKLQKIGQDIKEMDLRRAYADIVAPLADAGRIGNYLNARGRGLSVMDAIYQTKMAGANYSEHGTSGLMRGLSHATLFLNPALQSIDASARAAASDPMGYTMRAVASIALPSFWLWHAYKDDQEIKDLRQTEYGKRYWWFRVNGEIRKAPKPIFDGQMWGSSVESALDQMQGQDPDAMRKWSNSLLQDASINLLPTIGVIPITYASNFDLGLGNKLIPDSEEKLDIEYQDNANTSWLARVVSSQVAPAARAMDFDAVKRAASPIGIEYLIRNLGGDISLDMMRTLSIAVEYQKPGFSVSKEEAPIIMNVFPKYPTMNVSPIRDFYKHADRADVVSGTVNELLKHDPERLSTYIEENINEVGLMELYKETRASLSDLRAAIEDIRDAPVEAIPSNQKRELIDTIMRAMIERARSANLAANSVRSQTAANAKP